MRKLCLLALIFVSLTSCSTYQVARYEVENILAVTKAGDTIQVPISEFRRQYNYDTYSNWQFYYGNSWWYWNDWRYRYPNYNLWRYYDHTPTRFHFRPQTQPQRQIARIKGRRNETNTTNPRGTQQTQNRYNGRRSGSREVVPSQPARSKISTPRQPRQIRRGSGQPRIQQTQPRGRSSQQGSRPINRRKN